MKDRANRGREKRGFLSGLAPRVKRARKAAGLAQPQGSGEEHACCGNAALRKKEPRPSRGSQGTRLKA
jgi:hypothetical protein